MQFTFYQIFNIFAQMFFQIVSFYLTAMAAIGIVSAEDWLAFLLIAAQLGVIALIVLALINYRAFYIVYKTIFRDIK